MIPTCSRYFLGGSTFIGGTALFFPEYANGFWSAVLYTVGSVGFLVVDILELYAFTL
jgi:hypothetical protein